MQSPRHRGPRAATGVGAGLPNHHAADDTQNDMTAYQRLVLERYRLLRRTNASWGQLLRVHAPQWLWIVGANAVLAALSEPARPFVIGMAMGFILRDLSAMRGTRQFWPVFATLIDWSRVDTALRPEAEP